MTSRNDKSCQPSELYCRSHVRFTTCATMDSCLQSKACQCFPASRRHLRRAREQEPSARRLSIVSSYRRMGRLRPELWRKRPTRASCAAQTEPSQLSKPSRVCLHRCSLHDLSATQAHAFEFLQQPANAHLSDLVGHALAKMLGLRTSVSGSSSERISKR